MKRNSTERLLAYLGWMVAVGLIDCITPAFATNATVNPIDEPLCYMRTQDGGIVNLQSLCSHTPPQSLQSNPASSQPTQRTGSPQTTPTQGNVPIGPQRDPSGSHANGNPDSDDGRY